MTVSKLEARLRLLDRRAGALGLLAAAAVLLGGARLCEERLRLHAERARAEREAASVAREDLELELRERAALRDLVAQDLARAKENATRLTKSRRALFEGGLRLSEERRLLDKQWEIMTRWLRFDAEADRLQVMSGERIEQSAPLAGARPRAVGGETRAPPARAVVSSMERFAHPERGSADQNGGVLNWEPPQVGASVRANALGEYVLFTREGLVVHGPPKRQAEHEAYPHLCLTLPAPAARRAYASSFIGTRLVLVPEGA